MNNSVTTGAKIPLFTINFKTGVSAAKNKINADNEMMRNEKTLKRMLDPKTIEYRFIPQAINPVPLLN